MYVCMCHVCVCMSGTKKSEVEQLEGRIRDERKE